jgi:hypothetical protein
MSEWHLKSNPSFTYMMSFYKTLKKGHLMSITVIHLLIMIRMIRATSDQINKLALGQLSAIMLLPALI